MLDRTHRQPKAGRIWILISVAAAVTLLAALKLSDYLKSKEVSVVPETVPVVRTLDKAPSEEARSILQEGFGKKMETAQDKLSETVPPKLGLKPHLGGLAWIDNGGWIYPNNIVDSNYDLTKKEHAALKYVEEINRKDISKWGMPRYSKYKLKEMEALDFYGPDFKHVFKKGQKIILMKYFGRAEGELRELILKFKTDENGNFYVHGVL